MRTEKQTGRLMGGLLLTAMLLGLWNNFGLTTAIFAEPGWLQNGAQVPALFGASAVLGIVTSLMIMAAAILAWPILRQTSPSLALAYVMLSAIVVATSAVEQANFLAMRALSLQYAKNPGLDPALFEVMRGMVGAARHGIHYIDKLIGGTSVFVLFLALFRSNLVPRIIPAIGLVAAPIQMVGICSALFMQPMNLAVLAPIALMLLVLSLTLLLRGFTPKALARPA
ncbi:DUF4386 domain-containing protein [Paucibacter sp. TC2R-5]|uniref:DUF4386 domain-containing protein n=1 Tax=Paucibacter sp. TC2R-5 TaxID=2893555 RepID=UPI0021E367E3|nr:DUF4386 domain-containing protein [Paucibacter sp. TC2R-5]MCV2358479.1 DUF4386 domain-containing protein [Paucibacter sp. TC2R-5]